MQGLLRTLQVLVGALGIAVQTLGMPSANHLSIGSRCGGCRWTGKFTGRT